MQEIYFIRKKRNKLKWIFKMTRKEFSGTRELLFSDWVRTKLPDSSTGFLVTDLDFIIFNYKYNKF